MHDLFLRWVVSAVALGAVAWILPGIQVGQGTQGLLTLLVGAAVLSVVNKIVKPLLTMLSCPLIIVTLGLFLFVINAAMLLLASALSRAAGFPFYVAGWGSAILGSVLLTLVNWALSGLLRDRDKERSRDEDR
jgi:putative membrane protein